MRGSPVYDSDKYCCTPYSKAQETEILRSTEEEISFWTELLESPVKRKIT